MYTLASLLLLSLLSLGRLPGVSGIVMLQDSRWVCEPIRMEEMWRFVCINQFYYYEDIYGGNNTTPSDPRFTWIYEFVDETNATIGSVMIELESDQEVCRVGIRGDRYKNNTQPCQHCSFCDFNGDGPDDERRNGQFKVDCTNLPGGRMLEHCESTFPFILPVDLYATDDAPDGVTDAPANAAPATAESSAAAVTATLTSIFALLLGANVLV